MHEKMVFWEKCALAHQCPLSVQNLPQTPCTNGKADEYSCSNVDLLSFVNLDTLGTRGDGNDIWGWRDPKSGNEYALAALFDGTSFVDVTDPTNPHVIGFLPTHTTGSSWRDIKVYQNHAFIVSEAGGHGMQVFDLTQLRDLERFPVLFNSNVTDRVPHKLVETAWYGEFGNAHNLVINEETGFAYSVGTKTCRSGLHIVDISNPQSPKFAGCYADDGYVHDAQCVIYRGPDVKYQKKEICFCYDEDTLTIVDVSDKSKIQLISRISYNGVSYTHQGWLLKDSTHLLLNDELDELNGKEKTTRTLLWEISSLEKPFHKSSYFATEKVVDHNLYIVGDYAYLTNYCGGLRVLDLSKVTVDGSIKEVAYFDVSPNCDTTKFLGSWSSYPYFPSGTVVVNSIDRGLFVLKVHLPSKSEQ